MGHPSDKDHDGSCLCFYGLLGAAGGITIRYSTCLHEGYAISSDFTLFYQRTDNTRSALGKSGMYQSM